MCSPRDSRPRFHTFRRSDEGSRACQHPQLHALPAPTPRVKRNFGLISESTYFLLLTVVPDFPTNFQRTSTSRLRLTSLARRSQETLLFGFSGWRLADGRDNFRLLYGRKLAHPDFGDSPLLI